MGDEIKSEEEEDIKTEIEYDEIDFGIKECVRGTAASIVSGHWKDEFYSLDYENRGKCHIFSHKEFDLRTGKKYFIEETELETKLLRQTFQDLKFDVRVHEDKKKREIFEIIKKVRQKNHDKSACLVFCFLSLGNQTELYAADTSYDIDRVLEPFCESLPGKPKIFIFQKKSPQFFEVASRESVDSGVSDRMIGKGYITKRIPLFSDFLIASSTFSGTYILSDGKKVSHFVRLLCHALWKYNKTLDMLSILTLVNSEVVKLYNSPDLKENFSYKSTFTRSLKFT